MIRGEGGHFCAGAHGDALGAAGADPAEPGRYCDMSADPELSRHVLASFRREVEPSPTEWELAMEAERASQIWSLRRRAGT